jgi:hypothetical protein
LLFALRVWFKFREAAEAIASDCGEEDEGEEGPAASDMGVGRLPNLQSAPQIDDPDAQRWKP